MLSRVSPWSAVEDWRRLLRWSGGDNLNGMGFCFRWRILIVLAAAPALPAHYLMAQNAPAGNAPVTTLVEPPTPLLPHNPMLAPQGTSANVPPDSAETQAVLKEDGLKRMDGRAIQAPGARSQTQNGWVKAYEFTDATGAFAAYTYLRLGGKPATHGVNPTEFRTPAGESVFVAGTSVVEAQMKLPPASAAGLLKAVEIGLPKIGGRRGQRPLLPTLFPAKGYDANTLRYALGPAGYAAMGGPLPAEKLGWEKDAEVGTASYHDSRQTLTLLLYPTPQIAGIYGREVQDFINQKGPASFGTVKMKRLGPLVGVTTGDWPPNEALDTLAMLNLRQEVTFDKPVPPEFHAEVHKTATLLQSIAIFTGLGTLAAIVLGVFFGFGRAGIRVLQGKPAASEPEFLTINLRGQPKPLLASKSGAEEPPRG
jgi:hypothetical protein